MGRIKDIGYTKEFFSKELNIDRDTLNRLRNYNQDLHDSLLMGLVLKLEADKNEKLPFDEISRECKEKCIEYKIKELKIPDDKFYFLESCSEIIDFGYAFIKHYKIPFDYLNKKIERRNVKRYKIKKIEETE